MIKYGDFYHCEICGNVVSVDHEGGGELVCCGEPMEKLVAKTADASTEKHVPVIEPDGDNVIIKVGSVPHPMTEEHFISFIEVVRKDGKRGFAQLKGAEKPEIAFNMKAEDIDIVYEYCNVHGLWATK